MPWEGRGQSRHQPEGPQVQVKCQVLYSQSGPESQAILTDEETEAQGGEETASWGQSRDPRCVGLGWVWDRGGAVVTRCGGWLAKPQLLWNELPNPHKRVCDRSSLLWCLY